MTRGASIRTAIAFGVSCAVSKFPQAIGGVRFVLNRFRGRRGTLIEYKGPGFPGGLRAEGGRGGER